MSRASQFDPFGGHPFSRGMESGLNLALRQQYYGQNRKLQELRVTQLERAMDEQEQTKLTRLAQGLTEASRSATASAMAKLLYEEKLKNAPHEAKRIKAEAARATTDERRSALSLEGEEFAAFIEGLETVQDFPITSEALSKLSPGARKRLDDYLITPIRKVLGGEIQASGPLDYLPGLEAQGVPPGAPQEVLAAALYDKEQSDQRELDEREAAIRDRVRGEFIDNLTTAAFAGKVVGTEGVKRAGEILELPPEMAAKFGAIAEGLQPGPLSPADQGRVNEIRQEIATIKEGLDPIDPDGVIRDLGAEREQGPLSKAKEDSYQLHVTSAIRIAELDLEVEKIRRESEGRLVKEEPSGVTAKKVALTPTKKKELTTLQTKNRTGGLTEDEEERLKVLETPKARSRRLRLAAIPLPLALDSIPSFNSRFGLGDSFALDPNISKSETKALLEVLRNEGVSISLGELQGEITYQKAKKTLESNYQRGVLEVEKLKTKLGQRKRLKELKKFYIFSLGIIRSKRTRTLR